MPYLLPEMIRNSVLSPNMFQCLPTTKSILKKEVYSYSYSDFCINYNKEPKKDSRHVNDENSPETVKYKISKEGQEHFQNQVENGTHATFSDQNLDWKKVQQNSIYNGIIEKSDNGFNNPTIEMQLSHTYNDYLNKTYEKVARHAADGANFMIILKK